MNWLNSLLIPVAIIYLLVVSALFVYGLNFFHLAWHAWKHRNNLHTTSALMGMKWPAVTIQLPIYNERYVAQRLIEAAAALDYPANLLEIQVLNDSTDDTKQIVEETVQLLQQQGVNIKHLYRTDRQGYKAGALADGFKIATGEFIAIFDADFIPPTNFLKRVLPHFDHDKVGFVQARWSHLNSDYSLLTFLQSLSIDAHFVVEQLARSQLGYWFNFNGTAGIWRKTAIEDAGGWKAQTLTEDLDLGLALFYTGWEDSRYAGEVETPAELPVSMTAYRRQQHRWARGSLECAIRFVPLVLRSEAPISKKIEAVLHLTGYGVHLLLFALALLYPIVLFMSIQYPTLMSLFGIAILFNFTAFAPTTFFVVAQHSLGKRWLFLLPFIFFMTIFGAGMMVNTLRAALQISLGNKAVFERTPKYGITQRGQKWHTKQYRVRLDGIVFFELLLAALNLFTVMLAFQLGNYLIGIYAGLFALGLLFTSGFTVTQALSAYFSTARDQ